MKSIVFEVKTKWKIHSRLDIPGEIIILNYLN